MEIIVALITALGVVAAASIPVMRGARGAVRQDGNATRAAVTVAVAGAVESLTARMDARIDDVRDDLDEVRESVARVREWQAGHDAEHLIIPRPTTGGDA